MELTSVIGKVSGRDVLFALAFHSSDIKYQLIRTPLRSLLCHKWTKLTFAESQVLNSFEPDGIMQVQPCKMRREDKRRLEPV